MRAVLYAKSAPRAESVIADAELILDGAARLVDSSTLRMSRFAEGNLYTTT
jgi:hypothetical protein